MQTYFKLLLLTLVLLGTMPATVEAQTSCGDIIYQFGNTEPIADCANPFGIESSNSDTQAFFGRTELNENGVYNFLGQTDTFSFTDVDPRANAVRATLYRHSDEDYIAVGYFGGSYTFTATGTYTIVLNEERLSVSQTILQKVRSFLVPTAYAAVGDKTSFTFTVVADTPPAESEIDPLILQYAPILYLHPQEKYAPMNVEAFVEASALWDDNGVLPDVQLRTASDLTFDEFESIVDSGAGTANYYLAYSDPDQAKSISLADARTKYEDQVASEVATTTTYVRRMTDSYIDDRGVRQEFIVLQYWFFYAMNNWAEEGGFNDHEGDWESVFIYLDADTQAPKYVAFSAHHNDGDAGALNVKQFDSLRREWLSNDITQQSDNVEAYVALGSHANYPDSSDRNTGVGIDILSSDGNKLSTKNNTNFNPLVSSSTNWHNYQGKWGLDRLTLGGDGPQGPAFNKVSGFVRFENPLAWAGIDKISEFVTREPVTTVPFIPQKVRLEFTNAVPTETSFVVSPHNEPITFGIVPNKTTMLPNFWDIETSLTNGTFSAEVSITYDPSVVTTFNVDESTITAFFFNSVTNTWEAQDTIIDTVQSTATFTTTHFSRFALGIVEPKPTLEALFKEFRTEVDSYNLSKKPAKSLHKAIDKIEKKISKKYAKEDKKSKKVKDKSKKLNKSFKKLSEKIESYVPKYLSIDEANNLLRILNEIELKFGGRKS